MNKTLNARILDGLQQAQSGRPAKVKVGEVELIITGGKFYPTPDLLTSEYSPAFLLETKNIPEESIN